MSTATTTAEARLRDALLNLGVEDRHLLPLWDAVSALVAVRVQRALDACHHAGGAPR
jgi:hypothetical protein